MGRLVPLTLAALTLVLVLPGLAAPAAAPILAGRVSDGAEPSIVIAPHGELVVGDTSGIHVAASAGGAWAQRDVPELPGAFTDGRPLAFDAAGTMYSADTQGEVIAVSATSDLGQHWRSTDYAVGAAAIADRPWLAASSAGTVALVYYASGVGERCVASTDGGATWLQQTLDNGGPSNAGNVVVDAKGQVWYAARAYLVRWPALCAGTPRQTFIGGFGHQVFKQTAVDGQGDAFVAQPDEGNAHMTLASVRDMQPATLLARVLSPSQLHSNTYGAIASRLDGGEIAVAWYGSATAGDPAGAFPSTWDVYVARVTGPLTPSPTVTVTKVTATPMHEGGFCMSGISCTGGRDLLDYMGVAFDAAGNIHVAYGDDYGHAADVENAVVPAP